MFDVGGSVQSEPAEQAGHIVGVLENRARAARLAAGDNFNLQGTLGVCISVAMLTVPSVGVCNMAPDALPGGDTTLCRTTCNTDTQENSSTNCGL
jgi:hypothetical protein